MKERLKERMAFGRAIGSLLTEVGKARKEAAANAADVAQLAMTHATWAWCSAVAATLAATPEPPTLPILYVDEIAKHLLSRVFGRGFLNVPPFIVQPVSRYARLEEASQAAEAAAFAVDAAQVRTNLDAEF